MSGRAVGRANLFMGFLAMALALFAMALNPANSHFLGASCAQTEKETAWLRRASALLLLSGAAQALAAAAGLIAAEPEFAFPGSVMGGLTAYHLCVVVPNLVSAAAGRLDCLDRGFRSVLMFHYGVTLAMLCFLLLATVLGALFAQD